MADGQGFNLGVDPNLDPELALALRVSLEEERARQEAAQAAAGGEAANSGGAAAEGKPSSRLAHRGLQALKRHQSVSLWAQGALHYRG